jgi:RimJ/RimL family protein N-acetyltransferase
MPGPAYRVETDRLVLRCWDPDDASRLKSAVDASLEHLRLWMPWAHKEPQTLEEKVELMRSFRGNFDLGTDFVYGIFDSEEARVLGGSGLHPRGGEGAREIGYWLHKDAIGQGLATESTGALTRVGFELLGLTRLEIWVAVGNHKSAAIPARLGYTLEGVLRQRRESQPGELADLQVWTMMRDEYDESAAKEVRLRAYDVLGEVLLDDAEP